MASVTSVKADVFRLNTIFYTDQPRIMQVPCEGSSVLGVEYWTPVTDGCGVTDYAPSMDASTAQADTVKTLRIHNKFDNNTYWIMLGASDDVNTFSDNCNACCGTTPDMSGNTIPTPVVEQSIPHDASGFATYQFSVPQNPFALDLLVKSLTFNNGQTVGVPPATGGYALPTQLLTYLNTNASVMGTWSLVNGGKVFQLKAPSNITSANLDIDLEAAQYCLDLPVTPANIAYLTVKATDGMTDLDVAITATSLSEANRDGVLAVLKQHLVGELTIFTGVGPDYKINYKGTQKPVGVKSLDKVTTFVAFAAGACA